MQDLTITAGYMTIPLYVFGNLANSSKAILYLHGRGTSRGRQAPLCEKIRAATNIPLVLPEYSGHGDHPTVPFENTTPAMHTSEVIVVYDWLHKEKDIEHIIVYAGSYGAHMAASLMRYRKPSVCILQAPSLIFDEDIYTTRADVATYLDKINSATEAQIANNIERMAEGFRGKIMVMRSEHDDMIRPHVVNAWKRVYPQATYVTVPGAVHSMLRSSEQAKEAWISAVEEFLG